jgi:hypothetical protein
MTPAGGIAAINLSNGRTLWSSASASQPLTVVASRLVAQVAPRSISNQLELAAFNVQNGARTARGTTTLPAGVRVSVGETLRGNFTAEARRANGAAIASWTYDPGELQGRPTPADTVGQPPGSPQTQAPVQRRGAVRMNVATGAVTRLDATAAGQPRRPRWILPPAEKLQRAATTQYESADRRHVLATEAVADDRVFDKYRWTVYDRASGQRVGEHRSHIAFTPFILHGTLLIHETTPYVRGDVEQPAKLRAIDLRNGSEAWSVEVRELVYRGVLPP